MKPVPRPLNAAYVCPFAGGMLLFSLCTGRFVSLSVFSVALVGCCLLYAFASRYGIRVELQAPSRVNEGDNVSLSLLLRSPLWLPRFVALSVVEIQQPISPGAATPDKRKQRHQLFFRQAPEEFGGDSASFRMDGFIFRHGTSRVHRELELSHRGVVTIRTLQLFFADPLGIFCLRRSLQINHEILVRVRPSLGGSLLQISGSSGRMETQMKVGETGDMTEYAGARPYRPGDELRHIHWPTVARTGELYVREYTPSSAESVIVFLLRNPTVKDQGGWQQPAAGEFMLKATVALVIELFNRRVHTCFGENLGTGRTLNIGYSQLNLQRFHDEISAMSWDSAIAASMDFLEQMERVGVSMPCVVVFCVDTPPTEQLRQMADALCVPNSRFIVLTCPDSDGRGDADRLPRGMRCVTCRNDDFESLFASLVL